MTTFLQQDMAPYQNTLFTGHNAANRDAFITAVPQHHTTQAGKDAGAQAINVLWTALEQLDNQVHMRNEYDRIFMRKVDAVVAEILGKLHLLDQVIPQLLPCDNRCPDVGVPAEDPPAPVPASPSAGSDCDAIIAAVQKFHEELAQIIDSVKDNLDNANTGRAMMDAAGKLDDLNARVDDAMTAVHRQHNSQQRCAPVASGSRRASASAASRTRNRTLGPTSIKYITRDPRATSSAQLLFSIVTRRGSSDISGLLMHEGTYDSITSDPALSWQQLLAMDSPSDTPIAIPKQVVVKLTVVPNDATNAALYSQTGGHTIYQVKYVGHADLVFFLR